jgi:hypothetical protein
VSAYLLRLLHGAAGAGSPARRHERTAGSEGFPVTARPRLGPTESWRDGTGLDEVLETPVGAGSIGPLWRPARGSDRSPDPTESSEMGDGVKPPPSDPGAFSRVRRRLPEGPQALEDDLSWRSAGVARSGESTPTPSHVEPHREADPPRTPRPFPRQGALRPPEEAPSFHGAAAPRPAEGRPETPAVARHPDPLADSGPSEPYGSLRAPNPLRPRIEPVLAGPPSRPPVIEVTIGRIEVVQAPQRPRSSFISPSAARPTLGFGREEATRRHLDRRWY